MEETRDPADSHYTSISKIASGPSRSQCPPVIWPYMCQSVCVVVMCVQVIKCISGNIIYNGEWKYICEYYELSCNSKSVGYLVCIWGSGDG